MTGVRGAWRRRLPTWEIGKLLEEITLGQVLEAEMSLTGRGPGCHRRGAREEGVPRNSPLLHEGPVLPGDDKPLSHRKAIWWDLCFSVAGGQQLRVCIGRSREQRQKHLLVSLQHPAEQERWGRDWSHEGRNFVRCFVGGNGQGLLTG